MNVCRFFVVVSVLCVGCATGFSGTTKHGTKWLSTKRRFGDRQVELAVMSAARGFRLATQRQVRGRTLIALDHLYFGDQHFGDYQSPGWYRDGEIRVYDGQCRATAAYLAHELIHHFAVHEFPEVHRRHHHLHPKLFGSSRSAEALAWRAILMSGFCVGSLRF